VQGFYRCIHANLNDAKKILGRRSQACAYLPARDNAVDGEALGQTELLGEDSPAALKAVMM
jgi:hypothetical protein